MRKVMKWLGLLVGVLVIAAAALWFFVFRPPPPGDPAEPVATTAGPVRGLQRDGVTEYRGIPYAAPPVGQLRWREPQPVAPWRETREAFRFSKACPQVGGAIAGVPTERWDEDCLYLNVWTPTAASAKPRPVIVWVHGGSNTNGSASFGPYNGRRLAAKGVVFVSMNYRLGALGYLAHPELSRESGRGASGNYGMMDIAAALRWVRDNVAAFGGDPGNVTVMGHSAGARNISHLQVSPLARGLYRRIIAMSGGDFAPSGTLHGNAWLRDAEAAGVRFAERLGATSLADLRALPAERIIAEPKDLWRGQPSADNTLAIVDGYVVPSDPYALHAAGKAWPADLLLGYTGEEGINSPNQPADAPAVRRKIETLFGGYAPQVFAAYPVASDTEARRSWQRLIGETTFKWQAVSWARLHKATGRGNVFLYRFSHTPGIGPFRRMGPAHGAEVNYVFDFPKRGMRYGTQWPWNARRDIGLIDTVQDYWVNFARTGNPNAAGLPVWPAFTKDEAIDLGIPVRQVRSPDHAEHELIDRYIATLRDVRTPTPPKDRTQIDHPGR